MNLQLFEEKYKDFLEKDKIKIQCEICGKIIEMNKEHVRRNIISNNGKFICRSCSLKARHQISPMTNETKQKISKARKGYVCSEDTRQKMSEAKKAFYQTPKGIRQRKTLSIDAAKAHAENKLGENSIRKGLFESPKNKTHIAWASTYELRACVELEEDPNVASYESQIYYEIDGRGRCLDFLVTFIDGSKLAIEVKPETRLAEQANIDQINDSRQNAHNNSWDFEIWDENHFGMTCKELTEWGDYYKFANGLSDVDLSEIRKQRSCERTKKHYHKHIATDTVKVWCDYCQTHHHPLRLTYEKNIERNGEYICEAYGGHLAGKKPKPKKNNPYASEGKKQCNKCKEILPFDCFGKDKHRPDGYAHTCKECRSKLAKAKYKAKTQSS